jgi:hypothetical protein
VFGLKYFILNIKDNLRKFNSKSDDDIFLGYSSTSKTYKLYNHKTITVEESMYVVFDEFNPFDPKKTKKNWCRCCF